MPAPSGASDTTTRASPGGPHRVRTATAERYRRSPGCGQQQLGVHRRCTDRELTERTTVHRLPDTARRGRRARGILVRPPTGAASARQLGPQRAGASTARRAACGQRSGAGIAVPPRPQPAPRPRRRWWCSCATAGCRRKRSTRGARALVHQQPTPQVGQHLGGRRAPAVQHQRGVLADPGQPDAARVHALGQLPVEAEAQPGQHVRGPAVPSPARRTAAQAELGRSLGDRLCGVRDQHDRCSRQPRRDAARLLAAALGVVARVRLVRDELGELGAAAAAAPALTVTTERSTGRGTGAARSTARRRPPGTRPTRPPAAAPAPGSARAGRGQRRERSAEPVRAGPPRARRWAASRCASGPGPGSRRVELAVRAAVAVLVAGRGVARRTARISSHEGTRLAREAARPCIPGPRSWDRRGRRCAPRRGRRAGPPARPAARTRSAARGAGTAAGRPRRPPRGPARAADPRARCRPVPGTSRSRRSARVR